MKKTTRDKFIIILFFLMMSIISGRLIFAQTNDNQDEPEATESASPTVTESLKEQIQKTKEVLGDSDEESIQKRGFIGLIQRVSEEAITLENSKGTQIIPIDDEVELTKADEEIALSDVAIEDYAIVMGWETEDEFTPIKVIVTEEDLQPKPQLVILGSLSEIGSSSLTILTRDEQKEVEVQLTTQTQFENADGETITKTSLFEKLQIIAVGYVDIADKTDESDQDVNYATLVRSLAPVEN
jgi:hypothetical protein